MYRVFLGSVLLSTGFLTLLPTLIPTTYALTDPILDDSLPKPTPQPVTDDTKPTLMTVETRYMFFFSL